VGESPPGETYAAYSLFQQPWWLNAVAPGRWDEVAIKHEDRIVARLPFVISRRMGVTQLLQPPLTQTLGPWVEPSGGASAAVLERQMHLLSDLQRALPRADRFKQSFSPRLMNALPFLWSGHELHMRYTYRLEDMSLEEKLWSGINDGVRRTIKKARREVEVRDDLGLDVFLATLRKSFERQGLDTPVTHELLERIDAACVPRDARRMLFAQDAAGRVHAVVYDVFDRDVAYAILGGGEPALRSSGAGALLQWESLRRAVGRSAAYDFEGSMIAGVEAVYRRFGGVQTPYLVVSRARPSIETALKVQQAVRRARRAG
jgi:hypothetical protein